MEWRNANLSNKSFSKHNFLLSKSDLPRNSEKNRLPKSMPFNT